VSNFWVLLPKLEKGETSTYVNLEYGVLKYLEEKLRNLSLVSSMIMRV
jgi:hypothetical protein